jgi:hypothetical protein
MDMRLLGANWSDEQRAKRHALCVALFLVVAHVAMIAGMLDPTLLGAATQAPVAAPNPHAGMNMPM